MGLSTTRLRTSSAKNYAGNMQTVALGVSTYGRLRNCTVSFCRRFLGRVDRGSVRDITRSCPRLGIGRARHDTTIVLYYKGTPFETLIKPIDDSVSYKGTILALHGWNLSYNDWCDSTSLCDKAKAMGYVVVASAEAQRERLWRLLLCLRFQGLLRELCAVSANVYAISI